MTAQRDKSNIEIPWALVKEFSRASLPTASSSPVHHQKQPYTARNTPLIQEFYEQNISYTARNTPAITESNEYKLPSRFPSLPPSPDLVNPFNQHQGKRVPYNILHAYVVGTSPPPTPATGSFCRRTSPRTTASKNKKWKDKEQIIRRPDVKLTPVVQKIKDVRSSTTPQHLSPENSFVNKKRDKLVIEIPQLSPLGYLQNYKETWSPVEEKKLVDLWNQGTPVNKHKCKTTQEDSYKTTESTNHIYKLSKVSGGGPVNQYSYRHRPIIARKAEPPSVSTNLFKHINTWLEAGGDVPKFLKQS